MFREFVDVVDDVGWLSEDDVYVVDSPFGFVRLIDVWLRWVSDGPGESSCGAVFVVDSKGPFIEHAVVYAGDPDHDVAVEWAQDHDVFFYVQGIKELRSYAMSPHVTGWKISRA